MKSHKKSLDGWVMRTIEWNDGVIVTIDQTKLPTEKVFLRITRISDLTEAIRTLQIRGAPLLGAAAAYGLALTAYHSEAQDRDGLLSNLHESAQILGETRPTAVNLFWAIDRVMKRATRTEGDTSTVTQAVIEEAEKIAQEDLNGNLKIGANGSALIESGDTVLTHCNAGSLATVGYGTALGVIRTAWKDGKKIKVFATETRPLLQGARLTTFELLQAGIPVTLLTEGAVGYVMSNGLVDKVVVGADRILKDAVINKIGTYMIAVLAHEHNIPFYVAAPTSTFDFNRSPGDVIVEERKRGEITSFAGKQVAPREISVVNPAFDVTPSKYITAIITERGVFFAADYPKLWGSFYVNRTEEET